MPKFSSKRGSKYSHDLTVKVVLLGHQGVGKTCLLCRQADDDYHINYVATIGIDLRIKDMMIDNHKVKAQFWDTAGQERFHAITKSYYRDADGFIFVYDVTDLDSFIKVRKWIRETREWDKLGSCAVVGNKIDLLESGYSRTVTEQQGRDLAEEYGFKFWETSAKENINVEPVYNFVVEDIVHKTYAKARSNSSISSEGSTVTTLMAIKPRRRRKCC